MDRLIERKQMSTKTTFKRVALVAVAALGLGVLTSVAPASAAANTNINCTVAYTVTDGGICASIAGPANFVTVTATALSVYVVLTGGTFTDGTSSKTIAAAGTANIATPTVGTITANGYAITSGVASTTAQPIVVTVTAAVTGTVYASSTVTPTTGAAAAAAKTAFTYTNTDAVVTRWAAGAVSANAAYQFDVAQFDSTPAPMATASSKAVTATLSGPGTLTITGTAGTSAPAPYVALAAGGSTAGASTVLLYSDGRAGATTLTIAVNGVVVKTYSVTFYGSVAKYTVSSTENYINSNVAGSFKVTALDSLGTPVHSAAWFAKSSAATIAGVTAAGTTADCGVDGICSAGELATLGTSTGATTAVVGGLGVATITAGNADYSISATDTVEVTGATVGSITAAFDKSNVTAGESAYLVVTVKDAAGKPYADGAQAFIFGSVTIDGLTWNQNITWTPVTLADGVFKTSYAQGLANTTITVTLGLSADAKLATALRETTIVAKTVVDVDNSVAAAADAAAEATDAANAATDAANAAAEAADAATAAAQDAADAVAALSAQVATLIGALKAQLTALTNLVIKIQKKVKA